jgi:hypothetical protein
VSKQRGSTSFDYILDSKNTDFRQHPELYRIGTGEQGVLLVEPYRSEFLPQWKFKTVGQRTLLAISSRWGGDVRGAKPTKAGAASTTRGPAKRCR